MFPVSRHDTPPPPQSEQEEGEGGGGGVIEGRGGGSNSTQVGSQLYMFGHFCPRSVFDETLGMLLRNRARHPQLATLHIQTSIKGVSVTIGLFGDWQFIYYAQTPRLSPSMECEGGAPPWHVTDLKLSFYTIFKKRALLART